MHFFRFWVTRNTRTTFSVRTLIFFSLFVGITRAILETLFFGIEVQGSDILAYVPFYFSLPFIYSALLSMIPKIHYGKTLQPVAFATLLGILPPILDFILGSAQTHRVFYGYFLSHDYASFPWFAYAPDRNYPIGEAITVYLTIFFAAFFVYTRTQKILSACFAVLLAYIAYLIYSLVLPGLVSYLLYGYIAHPDYLKGLPVAQSRPVLFVLSIFQILVAWIIDVYKTRTLSVYFARILHFLPFILLTILGAVIAHASSRDMILACIVTLATAIAVTAQNDFNVTATEKETRLVDIANATAVYVYLLLFLAGFKFALLGLVCFSLSVLYHYPFFNMRATLFGSMKVEGLWGLMAFLTGIFSGFVRHPQEKIILLSGIIFGGFSLFSILKDAKDIHNDNLEGRRTVYTLLQKKKISVKHFNQWLAFFFSLATLLPGIFYYNWLSAGSAIHCILSFLMAGAILRIHRARAFQFFLFVVCCTIANLIIYEAYKI
ncbi:MAG: hypothetical protein LDLANPLL_01007 [Turneriella sp.]|nr:hypothetical protein [Turneriella sp.]